MPIDSAIAWSQRIGYLGLWARVHRTEEALLLTAPEPVVIAGALSDEVRLMGSSVDNRDTLLERLRGATLVIASVASLRVPGPAWLSMPPAPAAVYTPQDALLARQVLSQVRRAINEFRDERRLGLVRARNQLLRTILLTSLLGYAILALATIVKVKPECLIAAIAFFLVGATVGLFNRLYLDSIADTAVEDYGLSAARLIHTPLLSGLAALGGVLLLPMLSVVVNTSASASTQNLSIPALNGIFDLTAKPFGIVLAAIFGLTPTALISRLQQEAERYKSELKNSDLAAARR